MNKDLKRFLAEAEAQGFRPRQLRSGTMYLAPDGVGKVTVHSTPSDVRAFNNMVAEFRRQGMKWPLA